MEPRKLLSDILANGQRDTIASAWDRTAAAHDFDALPAGEYVAHVLSAELFTGKSNNTPGYKLVFSVLEGEHAGRRLWHDLWLTPAALPMSKRDLGKLGITSLEQLEAPIPPGIRCKLKVALRKDDDGTTYNRVRRLEVIGIDKPEPDAFAPADMAGAVDSGAADVTGTAGDAAADSAGGDASFDPAKLEAEGGAA